MVDAEVVIEHEVDCPAGQLVPVIIVVEQVVPGEVHTGVVKLDALVVKADTVLDDVELDVVEVLVNGTDVIGGVTQM